MPFYKFLKQKKLLNNKAIPEMVFITLYQLIEPSNHSFSCSSMKKMKFHETRYIEFPTLMTCNIAQPHENIKPLKQFVKNTKKIND